MTAGFKRITNIDFSKVVIGNMLRKHLRALSRHALESYGYH
jgi:hypothetical protein